MTKILRNLKEVFGALRGKPDLRDLYIAARDIEIARLNVKQFGYTLARQLEGKLRGVDCSTEPRNHHLVSKPTTQADMESPWFAYWCQQLKIAPIYHRKIWEYAFVLQCLHELRLARLAELMRDIPDMDRDIAGGHRASVNSGRAEGASLESTAACSTLAVALNSGPAAIARRRRA